MLTSTFVSTAGARAPALGHASGSGPSGRRRYLRSNATRAAAVLTAAALAGTVAIGSAPSASAFESRPGAKSFQRDLLFSADETRDLATRLDSAVYLCAGPVAAAAGSLGSLGAFVAGTLCMTQFPLWAAQAYYKGKRLGVTIQPVVNRPAYFWTY